MSGRGAALTGLLVHDRATGSEAAHDDMTDGYGPNGEGDPCA